MIKQTGSCNNHNYLLKVSSYFCVLPSNSLLVFFSVRHKIKQQQLKLISCNKYYIPTQVQISRFVFLDWCSQSHHTPVSIPIYTFIISLHCWKVSCTYLFKQGDIIAKRLKYNLGLTGENFSGWVALNLSYALRKLYSEIIVGIGNNKNTYQIRHR